MIKYSAFYGDFHHLKWIHRYFFFVQHFFEDTVLAIIEVFSLATS